MASSSPPTTSSSSSSSSSAAKAAEKEWNRCHAPISRSSSSSSSSSSSIPSCLYTDENPATTIKGCGFKNETIAKRTIVLTSQKGVRYKQYWTIKAMRERAAYHPYPTPGMRDAIQIFDKWLDTYEPPTSPEERQELQKEWNEYHQLCKSVANKHAYEGKVPTKEEIKRARQDIQIGKQCVLEGIQIAQRRRRQQQRSRVGEPTQKEIELFPFPLVAFTALFGGPGFHGYGKHTIQSTKSYVVLEGLEGLNEVVQPTSSKTLSFLFVGFLVPQMIQISYDRHTEKAKVDIYYDEDSQQQQHQRTTLTTLWSKQQNNNTPPHKRKKDTIHNHPATTTITTTTQQPQHQQQPNRNDDGIEKEVVPSWTCTICTFQHRGESKQIFLSCEVCGTSRPFQDSNYLTTTTNNNNNKRPKKQCTTPQQQLLVVMPTTTMTFTTATTTQKQQSTSSVTSSTITKTKVLLPTTLVSPPQSWKSKQTLQREEQQQKKQQKQPEQQEEKQQSKVSCSTEVNSSTRTSPATPIVSSSSTSTPTPSSTTPTLSSPLLSPTPSTVPSSSTTSSSSSWGSLKAPSARDVRGSRRKRQKAFDYPPPMMEYLVVMDFEWTADNQTKIKPIAEITQFPSILLKVEELHKHKKPPPPTTTRNGHKRTSLWNNHNNHNNHNTTVTTTTTTTTTAPPPPPATNPKISIPQRLQQKDSQDKEQPPVSSSFVHHPPDQQQHVESSLWEDLLGTRPLRSSSASSSAIMSLPPPPPVSFLKQDAHVVSVFDTYVRPTLNPTLTPFSINLTGITQDQVNKAPTLPLVLKSYIEWLQSQHLVDSQGTPLLTPTTTTAKWCFVTWGDCDIGSTLRQECQYKSLDLPACFYNWINLKDVFAQHYHQEPKGGLRHCVESIGGLEWGDGHAHNGFVDSINTAKIVRHMVQTGFRFTRPTRGLNSKGIPFGSRETLIHPPTTTTTRYE